MTEDGGTQDPGRLNGCAFDGHINIEGIERDVFASSTSNGPVAAGCGFYRRDTIQGIEEAIFGVVALGKER